MSRTNWPVEVYNPFTFGFDADGDLFAPNANFEVGRLSTETKVILADGGDSFFTPEIFVNPQPINFIWEAVDLTFINKLRGYVNNNKFLRITDHNGVQYLGKFVDVKPVWILGVEPDEYDIVGVFWVQPSPI